MTDLLPCPNPACGGECHVVAAGAKDGSLNWQARCKVCRYHGPEAVAARRGLPEAVAEAGKAHNAMPRERPWTRADDGLPKRDNLFCDVYPEQEEPGPWRWNGVSGFWYRSNPDTGEYESILARVTHWRLHVPPRHPEAK